MIALHEDSDLQQRNAPLSRSTVCKGPIRRRTKQPANAFAIREMAIHPLPNQLVFEFDKCGEV